MKYLFASILFVWFSQCTAAVQVLTAKPNGWKLENYLGGTIVVYFSGSQCPSGLLTFPSTATADDKNRFFSLMLAAKTARSDIFVLYNDDANCTVVSFGTTS